MTKQLSLIQFVMFLISHDVSVLLSSLNVKTDME